jgi:hypothetical protein
MGGLATLLPGDGEGSVTIPLFCLPGAKEGDWLRASFEIDLDKKGEMTREIDALMDELEK